MNDIIGGSTVLKKVGFTVGIGVIIPAAGWGTRMRATESKQFLMFQDAPILLHTLRVFEMHPQIDEVVVVVRSKEIERTQQLIIDGNLSKVTRVTEGGDERHQSVFAGLHCLKTKWILVHDAVRPFVTHREISRLLGEVQEHRAVTLGVPVKNTIKMIDSQGMAQRTLDRNQLREIHTPQAFCREILMKAHTQTLDQNTTPTDDAMLVELLGIPVKVVDGEYTNIKITTPEDLLLADLIYQDRCMEITG